MTTVGREFPVASRRARRKKEREKKLEACNKTYSCIEAKEKRNGKTVEAEEKCGDIRRRRKGKKDENRERKIGLSPPPVGRFRILE